MILIIKPDHIDLPQIQNILSQWTEKEEVDKYVKRIENEIKGITEFNMHFWVAKENQKVLGVIGLNDPLPKSLSFAKTSKPGEIKILYVDKREQGKGIGKSLVSFVESEAKKAGYEELLIRSAKRYENTAWGFYQKMGYKMVGKIAGSEDGEMMQVFEKKIVLSPFV
jgi:GNAT superfamily N-acetyltransferase